MIILLLLLLIIITIIMIIIIIIIMIIVMMMIIIIMIMMIIITLRIWSFRALARSDSWLGGVEFLGPWGGISQEFRLRDSSFADSLRAN